MIRRVGVVITIVGSALAGLLAGYLIWAQPNGSESRSIGDLRPERAGPFANAIQVAPMDFAILPCVKTSARGACAIIAAGGKRVLVGAPSGIGAGPSGASGLGEGGVPDAILLFALDAAGIEGLDEIRNRIWEASQPQAVSLIGGEGIEEIGAGLDQTFIGPDAVAYVRGRRKGGFDTPPLASRAVRHGDIAFNTGDLKITALAGGAGQIAYSIEYGGLSAVLSDCGAGAETTSRWPKSDHYVGCSDAAETYGLAPEGDWPLREPVFLARG